MSKLNILQWTVQIHKKIHILVNKLVWIDKCLILHHMFNRFSRFILYSISKSKHAQRKNKNCRPILSRLVRPTVGFVFFTRRDCIVLFASGTSVLYLRIWYDTRNYVLALLKFHGNILVQFQIFTDKCHHKTIH